MNTTEKNREIWAEHKLYGSTTVSLKGQVVIPANARKELGINSGDTLLVLNAPRMQGLVLLRAEAVEQMLAWMSGHAARLEKELRRYKSAQSTGKKES
jgi:AbrB family looped-hinge helix DNA binding protein